jgi:hypothetical protein
MTIFNSTSKKLHVLAAAAAVVILAGSLSARLIVPSNPAPVHRAPRAVVPAPRALDVGSLEVPCWSCPAAKDWPVRFQTDLDLLAPLGTGSGNAAEWFALFAKEVGPRADEAQAAADARVDGPEWLGPVMPPDHPLLLEAEPWVDQATMAFYPEIFPLDGYDTRITNLLFALNLTRSWVARGLAASDSESAMADFRRAIRLGRLLRQEDVVVISDLVGLACIHIGARGVYERALADGDLETALLASVVLGEVAPQRLRTMELLTSTDLMDSVDIGPGGGVRLELRPGKLDALVERAESAVDRRFRLEAIIGLNIVRTIGRPQEQQTATDVLDRLAADTDPVVEDAARWSRDTVTDLDQLKQWAVPANQ